MVLSARGPPRASSAVTAYRDYELFWRRHWHAVDAGQSAHEWEEVREWLQEDGQAGALKGWFVTRRMHYQKLGMVFINPVYIFHEFNVDFIQLVFSKPARRPTPAPDFQMASSVPYTWVELPWEEQQQ